MSPRTNNAEERNREAIEAIALGMRALGTDYSKYRQEMAHDNATYRGPIVAQTQNQGYVIQKVSPRDTVRHQKDKLPEGLQVGDNVSIGYTRQGVKMSRVEDRNLAQKHERKHGHRH
jgi:hypothetical protein